jgi:ABC-type phosphate/phosphonate transport system substrate-binding protein
VKNHVWNKEQGKYPALEQVGGDTGENPDGSLIVSRRVSPAVVSEVTAALIALENDRTPAAAAARDALKIRGYLACSEKDFAHTLDLVRRAGITKDFAFAF